MLIACGRDVDCEHSLGLEEYGGEVPLSHLNQDGNEVIHFNYDGSVQDQADAIVDFMNAYPDAHFDLAGHSSGSQAVIWAASQFIDSGGDPMQIDRVTVFDADLPDESITQANGEPRRDHQSNIDLITQNGVKFSSYNSWVYRFDDLLGTKDIPRGSQTSLLSPTHYILATDQTYWITWEQAIIGGLPMVSPLGLPK